MVFKEEKAVERSKKKLTRGLKRLLTIIGVVAALYLLALIFYALYAKKAGDAELHSFGGVIRYHLKGLPQLFAFSYGDNAGYIALSVLLYLLIVCWLVALIMGIIINKRKNRKVMWWPILLTLVSLGAYLAFASGAQKLWEILNQHGAFANNSTIVLVVVGFLLLGAALFFLSIIGYIWCAYDANLYPGGTLEEPEELPIEEDVIRQIFREELINAQPFKVVVVGKNTQKEEPAPAPAPEPEPEPEPEPIPEPIPEPVPEPEEVVEELPDEEPEEEIMPMEELPEGFSLDAMNRKRRETFMERILKAELETKANYNEIKNEALAYGIKARVSRTGEVFRLHKKKYMKIFLVGKTLKVYLALPPEDYKDSTFPIEDVGHRPAYAEIPLLFKVRSGLSVRRCKELIRTAAEKDGLQKKDFEGVNWVNELRTLNAEKAKEDKKK